MHLLQHYFHIRIANCVDIQNLNMDYVKSDVYRIKNVIMLTINISAMTETFTKISFIN